ncbi:acylphosphatase [Alkalicoccus daliensis]|uniref:Acylphosphatase n=1 Tax=Alkalicoccus daliensis TaxID=745820 RepID=A0A1H0DWI4_9BACI|nr:acylphosphatase [Alkalicoccus daliensis]SDN74449.1 acylphosphatase [Alkalicoccus daliensis]
MPRYDITVTGRVQGVGFRYFAQLEAKQRELTGWVKNEDDGSVRMEAEGKEEALNNFIRALAQARYPAEVDDIIPLTIESVETESDFRIIH